MHKFIRCFSITAFAFVLAFAAPSCAQDAAKPAQIHIKDMSWIDIRGLVNCGYTTVIVPTGGIEQNGPQMVLAKHDYIVGFAAESIAHQLGNTLVAPVISFVPQGDYAPPTGNMQFTGTIGVEVQTFELLLDNVARSLKLAGFKTIIFIGDHGQSQASQVKIAAKLSSEWRKDGIRVMQIASYYDDKPQYDMLARKGETLQTIGIHAGLIDTSELMSVNAAAVGLGNVPGQPEDTAKLGGSGTPSRASAELGRELLDMRIHAAVAEIRGR